MCGDSKVAEEWSNGNCAKGEVQGHSWEYSEDTAFVVEEECGLSSETDRRLREAQFPRAPPGGRSLGDLGKEEQSRQHRKLEGGTRVSGRQQKKKQMDGVDME